jgi:hypothetical protein
MKLRSLHPRQGRDHPTGLFGLEKTFAFNLSGHVLHSIFW